MVIAFYTAAIVLALTQRDIYLEESLINTTVQL